MSEESSKHHEYYEISSYPFGGGWGGNSYYRLKDPNGDGYFKEPLRKGTVIEILWPDHTTSTHHIFIETTSSSDYERDSGMTLTEVTHHPYVSINFQGTALKKVKLQEIKNIKVRIVKAR